MSTRFIILLALCAAAYSQKVFKLPPQFKAQVRVESSYDAGRIYDYKIIGIFTGDMSVFYKHLESQSTLDVYYLSQNGAQCHIEGRTCQYTDIDENSLTKDWLFPLEVVNGKVQDMDQLFKLNGAQNIMSSNPTTKVYTLSMDNQKAYDPQGNELSCNFEADVYLLDDIEKCTVCRVRPLEITGKCGVATFNYTVALFDTQLTEADTFHPDGLYCTGTGKIGPRPVEIPVPDSVTFIKEGDWSTTGYFDKAFGLSREDEQGEVTIIDYKNGMMYQYERDHVTCQTSSVNFDEINSSQFVFKFDVSTALSLSANEENDVLIRSVAVKEEISGQTLVRNIYVNPKNKPVRVTTIYNSGKTFTETFASFSSSFSWNAFDLSPCAKNPEDIYQLVFNFDKLDSSITTPDLERNLITNLLSVTKTEHALRFTQIKRIADNGLVLRILPKYVLGSKLEKSAPDSSKMVSDIAAAVENAKLSFSVSDKKVHPRSMTYETLGTPLATYKSSTVAWMSVLISICSLIFGVALAIFVFRALPPSNRLRVLVGI